MASCCKGYTFYNAAGPSQHTPLIDMDGGVVHQWPISGSPARMLPGGSLLGSKRRRLGRDPLKPPPEESSPPVEQPAGEDSPGEPPHRPWFDAIDLTQMGWDGNEEWCFTNWDDDRTGVVMSRQHHDLQREGNPAGYYAPGQEFVSQGKTLILAHKNKLVPEISDRELEDDVIYEVDWAGNLTGWEWHAADHFDEFGFDPSAREAIHRGVQFDEEKGFCDWLHLNSMSLLGKNHWYDEAGDERFNPGNIIICSRHANFVAIIRRATGGIVWRVGPDFAEGTPEHKLGQFVGPHHAHMIPWGLPGAGNILIFDNGGKSGYGGPTLYPRYQRDYSRIVEFNPVTLEVVWEYVAENFYSHFVSSAQRLPNGNTLITEGAKGRLFEVTPDKGIVWEFIAPPLSPRGNQVYRAYRVPPEWVPGNPAGYPEWAALYE